MTSLSVMMNSTGLLDEKLPLFLTVTLWNMLARAQWSLIIQNLQSQRLQCRNFPGDCFPHFMGARGELKKLKSYDRPNYPSSSAFLLCGLWRCLIYV